MSLPHRECTARRPRRSSESSMMSSWTSVAVWMNSTTAAYRTARSPVIAAQPRRHEQHGGPHPLAAARLDVAPDLRDDARPATRRDERTRDPRARGRRESVRRSAKGPGVFSTQWLRLELYHGRNRLMKVRRRVRDPSRSTSTPMDSVPARPTTCATNAGSLRLPRCGTGARNGLSVSASRRSSGTSLAGLAQARLAC